MNFQERKNGLQARSNNWLFFRRRRLKRTNPFQSAHPSENIFVHQTYRTHLTPETVSKLVMTPKHGSTFKYLKKIFHNFFLPVFNVHKMRHTLVWVNTLK